MVQLLINVACITGIAFCVLFLYAIIMTIIKGVIGDARSSKDDEIARELVNQILMEAIKEQEKEEKAKKSNKKV